MSDAEEVRYARQLCRRYHITALDGCLKSCEEFEADETLNVAIFGRFKAGKSSFLNHLLGGSWLPVGVIPVTSVVTEIDYGPQGQAEAVFQDGRREPIALERIGEFISEIENPENRKRVALVRVELAAMQRYRGIRFVDTPGLESVLDHNTEASLEWLPKVGLALVAIGVDPPLSQHDLELIRTLGRSTPNISVLLTKVDVLENRERAQVQEFVEQQLARSRDTPIPVFPYSTRPGFEHLRAELDSKLLFGACVDASGQRAAILRHKIDALLQECGGFITLALKTAEAGESERQRLRKTILGEKRHLDDARQALRLITRHAAQTSRAGFEAMLQRDELTVRERLLGQLHSEFPGWTSNLATALERFDAWLRTALLKEMAALSSGHHDEFVEPVHRAARQLSQSLQDFRNRLSERSLQALGVPLETSEMELGIEEPKAPDARLGKIFDRNWELLSAVLPMALIEGLLRKHFERKVADAVVMNLSRLASQWEETVNASLGALEKEAIHRLDRLIATIESLTGIEAPELATIRADLARLAELRARL